eukprot:2645876-Pleurochrysis_carterae.AAC.1
MRVEGCVRSRRGVNARARTCLEKAKAQIAEPEVAEVMAIEVCLMRSASDRPKRYSHTAVE